MTVSELPCATCGHLIGTHFQLNERALVIVILVLLILFLLGYVR